ncbi:MAG: AAA family ATPase [Planctomycetaceae bacterium]|nr:AAA family ATPase [Planctomycetaceae bacterium]
MPEQLRLLIQAGHPLISIETIDEERALDTIHSAARKLNRPLFHWSMYTGLTAAPLYDPPDGKEAVHEQLLKPGKTQDMLLHLLKEKQPGVYVFKDFGPHCKEALIHRLLREILHLAEANRMTIVMIDSLPIPDEIRRLVVRYELGWPSVEELEEVLKQTFLNVRNRSFEEITLRLRKGDRDRIVQSLRGLSCREAARVIASAIYDDNQLDETDLPRIIDGKRQLLSSSGCLESIAADFSPDDIGGLSNLKNWLSQRRGGFAPESQQFGLEWPRGVLMLGVPGCGKSLCAKVVAADWGMPLLRLDPGVLYQKYIGESENQLRQALRQAEAMAPVILWVDEIEKAFASAQASSADGGLSKRMFGTLLSWMQDHRHPIFLVATANDISALPPELMRKGRFDEVFFVDLPQQEARRQILEIHLSRRKIDSAPFDLDQLAAQAEEFSGSELEQVVISAQFAAYHAKTSLSQEHLSQEISKTRPLATLSAETIARLRSWAEHRCIKAD